MGIGGHRMSETDKAEIKELIRQVVREELNKEPFDYRKVFYSYTTSTSTEYKPLTQAE